MQRVVITGMGTINPLGNDVNAYWNALVAGTSGAGPITRFDASNFKTRFACEVKDFDPQQYIEKAAVRRYDRYVQFAFASTAEAIKQSGLLESDIDKERVGVIWGTGNGGIGTIEEQVREYVQGDGTPRFSPFLIPKMIVNIASGVIAIKYGFKGINYTASTACASANSAMMDALNYIRWGKADVIIAGGSEASVTPACMGGFGSMKALSTSNDHPQAASRPFDKQRNGFVMGEGSGALVFESYEHAVKRGATILAEVAGAAMTSDAYHISATHPDGEGATRAMKLALQDAGLTVHDIDYINAHATSTPIGDTSELTAIHHLLEGEDKVIAVSATKSMTGHLLGAAGAIEAIASIKAIRESIIPPTINVHDLDEHIPHNIEVIINKPALREVNVAMSNTFGFGGHNAIVVFKKWNSPTV